MGDALEWAEDLEDVVVILVKLGEEVVVQLVVAVVTSVEPCLDILHLGFELLIPPLDVEVSLGLASGVRTPSTLSFMRPETLVTNRASLALSDQ